MDKLPCLLSFLWLLSAAAPAVCQEQPPAVELTEKLVETEHETTIAGQTVPYRVTTGRLMLRSDDGTPRAAMFFTAYTRRSQPVTDRPLTFCFNGGPGSSSVWLHLGMLGPQRVRFPDDASFLKPPYRLEPIRGRCWTSLILSSLIR